MVDEFDLAKTYNAGFDLYEQERYEEAVPFFYRAYTLNPFLPALTYTMSQVFHRLDKYKQCEEMARETLRMDPDHTPARANLGLSLIFQNRFDEARKELDKVLAVEPNNPEYLNAYAIMLTFGVQGEYKGKTSTQLGNLNGEDVCRSLHM